MVTQGSAVHLAISKPFAQGDFGGSCAQRRSVAPVYQGEGHRSLGSKQGSKGKSELEREEGVR